MGFKEIAIVLYIGLVGLTGCTGHSDKSKSHYDAAERAFSNDSSRVALSEGLQALDNAESCNDARLIARSHELLADIYRDAFNLRAARIHRREAVDAYSKAGMRENAFYAALDLAGEYSHESNDSTLIVLRTANSLLEPGREKEKMELSLISSDILRVCDKFPEALAAFRSIGPEWRRKLLSVSDSVRIGDIYHHCGMSDSAAVYFDVHDAEDYIQYWSYRSEILEKKGLHKEALESLRILRDMEHRQAGETLSNSLEFVERSFYERKAQYEASRRRNLINALAWGTVFIIIVLLSIILARYRRRNKSLQVDYEILDTAIITTCQPDDREKWVNVILDYYMTKLNAISKEYFRVSEPEDLERIRMEFNRELSELRNSDVFTEIERHLNERDDNIVSRLRRQFPRFSEQYIRLMLCHLAGLSSQSACLLLSIGKGNYYVMWNRIRARIRESDVPDRQEFERLFCKK